MTRNWRAVVQHERVLRSYRCTLRRRTATRSCTSPNNRADPTVITWAICHVAICANWVVFSWECVCFFLFVPGVHHVSELQSQRTATSHPELKDRQGCQFRFNSKSTPSPRLFRQRFKSMLQWFVCALNCVFDCFPCSRRSFTHRHQRARERPGEHGQR